MNSTASLVMHPESARTDPAWDILEARDQQVRRLAAERDHLRADCEQKESVISALSAELPRLREDSRRAAEIPRLREEVRQLTWRAAVAEEKAERPPLKTRLREQLIRCSCPNRHPLGELRQHPPRPLRVDDRAASAPPDAPGFCVVTPSFRQGAFIERTLLSVLGQAYPRLRYGVQDGGSDDGTRDVLRRHASRLAYWDSRPDGGQGDAINAGFARMEPRDDEIMAWLNSDDILLPGSLAYVAAYFARNPRVDAVYGHRVIIDEQDREVGRWFLPRHRRGWTLDWVDYVPQETLFWRARAWKRTQGLDRSYQFALDWAFLVELERQGLVIRRLPRFLGGFRVHESQKTHLEINDRGLLEMERLRERHGADPVAREKRIRRTVVVERLRSRVVQRLWSLGVKV